MSLGPNTPLDHLIGINGTKHTNQLLAIVQLHAAIGTVG